MFSHRRVGGVGRWTRSFVKRFMSHTSSKVVMATTRYSTLVEDLMTIRCFFGNQEIGLPPKKMMNDEVEVLSSLFLPQSTSM